MSDNKKYYYMKLKENFFDDDGLKVLEALPDGYLYSNILLKMYLRSLKNEGKLMLNEFIPYNVDMLSAVTNHQVGTVERAIGIFKELGLIDILDNGAIYMLNIQQYIGADSSEAIRKREYRSRIAQAKNAALECKQDKYGTLSQKRPPEIEIEIDKEIEKDNNICSPNSERDIISKQVEEIWLLYPNKKGKATAIKKLPKLIKEYGYEKIKRCVERYALECKGKDKQYVKHGSTFFNGGYMDYLDENIAEANKTEKSVFFEEY